MSNNGVGSKLDAGPAAEGGAAAGKGDAGPARSGDNASEAPAREANVLDRSFQLAYKVAYRMMRVYWGVRRPATHGALVTLWNQGELLLIQNSYVTYRSLPGGYVGRYETGAEAAVRELREEIGVTARTEQLEKVYDEVKDWEGKRDHVEVFKLELSTRPVVRIDHREVIEAGWYTPARALELDLFPPIRLILEAQLAGRALIRI
jgi:8-oxo-dGTP pyrophosphatase MutT (NUDIX family)